MAHAELNSPDRRKRWRARNAEKDAAHRAVENFVRSLKRRGLPLPTCKVKLADPTHECKGLVHAMHSDYSRPLDVEWACASYHISDHWENAWSSRDPDTGKRIVYIQRTTVMKER